MKLQLHFKSIIDSPRCKIIVNDIELYNGVVNPAYSFVCDDARDVHLRIEHYDKKNSETIVDPNGTIVRDRSFELERIIVDEYDFEHLIWKSFFQSASGEIYHSCLFFGPNGSFNINFRLPILEWLLETNNEGDDSWREDYEYYNRAMTIVKRIHG